MQDEWVAEDAAPADYRPIAASPIVGARSGGASYNVWAFPLESPNHGDRSLAVSPEDPTASPLGWHDTGDTQYTITRGNNVHAYEDRANANVPGFSPDGGADLIFDFPVDFETDTPVDYEAVAITNLFYWNNIFHDVLVAHGFDEAAGQLPGGELFRRRARQRLRPRRGTGRQRRQQRQLLHAAGRPAPAHADVPVGGPTAAHHHSA